MPIKPCNGYPSRTACALALRSDGLSHAAIADRINQTLQPGEKPLTASHVATLIYSSQIQQHRRFVVQLDEHSIPDLERAAARRRITLPALVASVLNTITRDNLVDAILDDTSPTEAAE